MTQRHCLRLILVSIILTGGVATASAGTAQGHVSLDPGAAAGRGADSESRYVTDLDRNEFDFATALQAIGGRELVDVDIRWTGTEERYSAIFHPVTGTIHTLIQGTPTDWTDFFNTVGALDGRFLDVEVGYFGADKRYSAVFLEDGDDYSYALRTTNSESGFQDWLEQYLNDGLSIIDFEAYTEPDGDQRFAGVWVNDPNQPRTVLYYHLEAADVSDLLRPLAGRLIDFERYYSDLHEEYRYAVIAAMTPGGEWGHFRWLTRTELDDQHALIADADTHISDIETWESGGTVYYGALWGDTFKSLYEVDGIPSDTDPQALPTDLTNLLSDFESGAQGLIGVYAKNLRTNQSLAWRSDEPFYLASSAKTAVHIKLWQEIEAGRVDQNALLNYTECASCRNNWFVDSRSFPGFDPTDFGSSFAVERFDRAMMQVSDNAATSALVDDEVFGVSWDATDLNQWLAAIPGVGRGWWPVTSIHDVDRTILWQGQVTEFPNDTSYFTIPGWAFEAQWRNGTDTYGDLAAWLGNPPSLPRYNSTVGHARYYAMGLNSATPKAYVNLLEGLWEGDFLDAVTTRTAIERMTEWTPLDDQVPAHVDAWSKGGVKGGESDPRSNTAILEVGPDAVAVAVLTKDNTRSTSTIDSNYMSFIGGEVAEALFANLKPNANSASFPDSAAPGDPITITTVILNDGGGDTGSGFDVTFYASDNAVISTADYEIGTVRMPPMAAGDTLIAQFNGPLPVMPQGINYRIGWIIDSDRTDSNHGEVGEYDEGDQIGIEEVATLLVIDLSGEIFADGFESGDTDAWSN
jgi:hypothetical protein